eukprot:gene7890-28454_t
MPGEFKISAEDWVKGACMATAGGVAMNRLGGRANLVVNTGLGVFVGAWAGVCYASFHAMDKQNGGIEGFSK